MGYRPISNDLHEAAVRLVKTGKLKRTEVLSVVGYSNSTLKDALRRDRLTGSAALPEPNRTGRPPKAKATDIVYLKALMRWKPSLFLREYRALLDQNRCLLLAHSTIHDIFERERISCKQLTKIAFEQDPELRLDFQYRITRHQAHQLLCCDEMSKNDLNYARLTGRAPSRRR
jgi:transposase